MLWNVSVIKGYAVAGSNGPLGTASDFLFDDASWKMRWLIVDTGDRCSDRQALVPASVLDRPDPALRCFSVNLTVQEAKNCQSPDQDLPVSRQGGRDLHAYYGWEPYLAGSCFEGAIAAKFVPRPYCAEMRLRDRETATPPKKFGDPHLRSVEEIIGYHVHATDGEIGHVEDFLAEESGWDIRSVKVSTKSWISRTSVLVSPVSVTMIDWIERLVFLDIDRQKVKLSTPYDPRTTVDGRYAASALPYYDDRWSLP
jgi:hypothetical protein